MRLLGLDARRAMPGDVLKDVLTRVRRSTSCSSTHMHAPPPGARARRRVAHARRCPTMPSWWRACLGGERRGGGSGKSARFVYCAAQKYGDTVVDVLRATALHDAID
ncbi:MAG: hypothetical protein ACLTMP_10215 [Eggerthella lenta]